VKKISSFATSLPPRSDPDMFRLLMEASPTPTIVVREDGSMAMVNEAAEKLFGYEPSELIGQSVELLLPEGLTRVHEQHRAHFVRDPNARPMGSARDLYVVPRDQTPVPVEIGLTPVATDSGLMVVCTLIDLSERKRTEEDLRDLADRLEEKNQQLMELVATDSLTSLRSRQAFMDHLSAQLEISARHFRPLSLLILDIDHFKDYNDNFEHLAGDEVLRKVGKSLKEASRRSDVVARLGGEEFGIILPETDREGATRFGSRFREAIEATDWRLRSVTVSVGATTVEFRDVVPRMKLPTLPQILTEADQALYRSKDLGRNQVTHAEDITE
jgi:diguanylate cyclase (GGDEF)-like protein/PAS domain S-box-containing protein